MMPRCTSSAVSDRSLFVAPRALNEPVAWRHSSLSRSSPSGYGLSLRTRALTRGVLRTCGAMRAAAIRTSSTVIMMQSPVVETDGLAASHTVAEHVEATELYSRTDGWCGVA